MKYQALIDGTNGDTRLEVIDAWFLSSYLHATGAVLDAPKGQHGRTVSLDVAMDKSRIEDVMTMVVKAASPPMIGGAEAEYEVPAAAGDNDVVDRLRLDGQFWIAKARFTNYDVQGKIEELSKRGRGKTAEPDEGARRVGFPGRFKLGGGRLLLPEVSFDVPGARVELAGSYALKRETLDFKGQLLLDAKISQTTTGWQVAAAEGRRSAVQAEETAAAARFPSKLADRGAHPTSASTSVACSSVEISEVTTSCNPAAVAMSV